MQINLNNTCEFLTLLTGEVDPVVTWQLFYDPKTGPRHPELASHFTCNLSNALPRITWAQERQCGVYITLNHTDGKGRHALNITGYRGLFADFDGMEEPKWNLTPHFTQARDLTHGHAFWLVSDISSHEEFTRLQMRIQLTHATDHQVCDPARIVRVSGFNHYKDPLNPTQYVVTDDNTEDGHKYTVAEIIQAFPLTAKQDAEVNAWFESRKGNQDGSGYENNEVYNKQFVEWLINTAPPAIQGSGSHTVFKVACWAHDHGIPLETCQTLMWDNYNPKCVPPWDITEKENFTETAARAYHYPSSAAGCKTAVGAFKAEGPVPEPIGGWEENKKLNDKNPNYTTVEQALQFVKPTPIETCHEGALLGRLTSEQASVGFAMLNSKTNHYELARAVDGLLWNGRHIIKSDNIFYVYNGKIWLAMGDDVIKSKLLHFYAGFKPNGSLIRGILDVLSDLVNIPHVQSGMWLVPNGRDASGLVVFKNGTIDINKDVWEVEPHDSNLFIFNALSFDFNPKATCPLFMEFIHEIFQGDTDLIKQLMQWIGYCISHDTLHHKFAVFVGKSRAGKGVLADLIRLIVGASNTVAPSLSNIIKDSTIDSMSKASLALIPDAHSVNFSQRDNVLSMLKAMTAFDPISYHVMYKGAQTRVIPIKMVISTNNIPKFEDVSGALANRMLVFPFDISFEGREDVHLREKLIGEIEGICQFALQGLASLRQNGRFTESKVGLIEKQEIKEDMFPLSQFIENNCYIQTSNYSTLADLYNSYKVWAMLSGVQRPLVENDFNKMLKNSNLPIKSVRRVEDGGKVRGFTGIKVAVVISAPVNNVVVPFTPVPMVNA